MTPRSLSRLLLLSTAVAASGCSGSGAKASLPASSGATVAIGVRAQPPQQRLEGNVTRATGQLRARLEAILSAPATGTVAHMNVKVGDRVKKGQVLMQLDVSNMLIALDQAKAAKDMAAAALENASTELARTQQLRQAESVPQSVLDRVVAGKRQAEAAFAQADAALRLAQETLSDHTLRAPFEGVVTARLKNVGDTVAMMPPTPILALTQVDDLEVRLPVPESLVDTLAPGLVLKGKVSPAGTPFEARVTTIGAVVDLQSRTVEVLADVVGKPGAALRPGALVEMDLSSSESLAGLFLPSQALLKDTTGSYVWVVEGERTVRRDVQAEPATPQFVRVHRGLGVEDRVVVDGAAALAAGTLVQVVQ
jgi:RND family efflux transporter MFP subunit